MKRSNLRRAPVRHNQYALEIDAARHTLSLVFYYSLLLNSNSEENMSLWDEETGGGGGGTCGGTLTVSYLSGVVILKNICHNLVYMSFKSPACA